ncbi:MAG: hypothetical protein K0R76_421 [Alphaproteobacteria bacterium]|nr:hypothetical protein [Alphaproteobacteria bacterium]
MQARVFSNLENANAILNGMDDCCDEFVEAFTELHKQPIDNNYMYDWMIRSLIDVVKVNHSILYVACGTAGYTRLFKNARKFVGIDFSQKMIQAAKKLNQGTEISYEFHCTTLENFSSKDLFDVIYLGPYGHNVPYTSLALEKAKNLLNDDGMIFCTLPDPNFTGYFSRAKELLKQIIYNKTTLYDPVKKLEYFLRKSKLNIYIKMRMKTSLGHAFCYVVKKDNE